MHGLFPTVDIAGRTVGDPLQPFIVAEMAWAHDGKSDHAMQIVDGAADAGADALNIHLTDLPSYMVTTYGSGPGRVSAGKDTKPIYEYVSEISLTPDDFRAIAARVRGRSLLLSTMCNDLPSLIFADELRPDVHVLAPACFGDAAFVEALASRRVPVVVSVGGATLAEIESVVRACRRIDAPVVLQYGYQAYPTKPSDLDLRYMITLREAFGAPVAYHDHTDGEDPAAYLLPLVALGMGVGMLEKHMTYDRAAKSEDFESAFGPPEMKRFVESVRSTAKAIGTGSWRPLNDAEVAYRSVVRKRIVARRDLAAGVTLTAETIAFKRSDGGLPASDFALVEGRTLAKARRTDEPIDLADVT